MSENKTFSGPLASYLKGLLEEKRRLGFKYDEHERLMHVLDEMSKLFNCTNGLSKELCLAFVKRDPNWHQSTHQHRVALIRTLAKYMARYDISVYTVDASIVTKQYEGFKPYIFNYDEINNIFCVADKIKPHSSRSHIFYPVILRVQYGCGLRISETLGLKMKDVDFENKIFHVKNAKNNKDRDVPFSESLAEYLNWYKGKIHLVYSENDYFFKSNRGTRQYSKSAVNHYFRDILFECGIKHGGRKYGGPHLHNLRHTFCVHSMSKMLHDGIHHGVALPLLMTYLGHSTLSETGKYLKLTAEAFPDLVNQINQIYNQIIPDLEVKTEYEDN